MMTLQERARRASERAAIRSWEYRQRDHSHGVWYRLRRVLVDAESLWVIDEGEADRREAGGREAHPVGRELSPTCGSSAWRPKNWRHSQAAGRSRSG